MMLFVDYIAAKHIIAPALNSVVGGPSRLYDSSRVPVSGAINALVKTAMKSGDIRKDLEPFDLLRALIGVSNVATGPRLAGKRQETGRYPNHGFATNVEPDLTPGLSANRK